MASDSTTITMQSWGQKMILKTGEDITGYTHLHFIFRNELGVAQTAVDATCDDAAIGEIYYVIPEDYWADNGDVGFWKVIGEVTFASGKRYTRPVTLNIVDQWSDG